MADADDCGGGICNCYLGPPLPLSAGLTPACVVNRFANDVSGTVNVDTGDGTSTVNLRSVVFLGVNVFEPCPFCDGDTTPGDGVRDGTCTDGPNDGDSCDADAINTTFPWTSTNVLGGGTSLDCFPDPGVNVSGGGLAIDLALTTGTAQLDSTVPCGLLPFVHETCACGQCSGNATIPCTTNAVCTAAGAGTCLTIGQEGRPDQCAGAGVCNDVGGGEGLCAEGPDTKFCDAALRATGEPFISCLSNGDCNQYPGTGVCTLVRGRACFLPTITARALRIRIIRLESRPSASPRRAMAASTRSRVSPAPAA